MVPAPAPASDIFMACTAACLTIRGQFARRARARPKIGHGSLGDRLLIVLVGVGQIVLPLVFVPIHSNWPLPGANSATRA